MNYELTIKQARLKAVQAFFNLHGKSADNDYLDWFYENFLGICKNLGFLHANDEPLDNSPYVEFALKIYELGY